MTFPATIPATGGEHTENGVTYIVRNSRWEKLKQPRVVYAGNQGGVDHGTQAAGKNWFYCEWDVAQKKAVERLRVTAAFRVNAVCYAGMGVYVAGGSAGWMDNSHYKETDGQVRWASSGDGASEQSWESSSPAWPDNNIFLAYPATSRKCKAGSPQFADITLQAIDGSNTLLCWKFYSNIVTDNLIVWNTARARIDKPITDLTALSIGLTDGAHFQYGRMSAEVY